MVVRIAKQRLRKGMFVEAVECESRVFGKRRFLIDTDSLLKEILSSPAEWVLVNSRLSQTCEVSTVAVAGTEESPAVSESSETLREVGRVSSSLRLALSDLDQDSLKGAKLGTLSDEVRGIVSEAPVAFFHVTRLQSFDEATYKHSLAVSGFMMKIGETLKLGDPIIRQLGVAGLVHDVGKLFIPTDILNKAGPLTTEERAAIRSHPEKGYRILRRSGVFSQTVLDIARYHHEMLDGSGYPHGLKEDEIGLLIRISTICDVFDALTSIRPYKRAWNPSDALRWLFERPQQFDQKITLKIADFL